MDEAHIQELERILQNRRSRGALLTNSGAASPAQASPPRQSAPPQASSPPRPRSAAGIIAANNLSTISRSQPQIQSNIPFSSTAYIPKLSYGNAAEDTAALRRVITQQEELRALHSLQERKVEALQGDIRRDLETVKSALFSVIQKQDPLSPPGLPMPMPSSISSFSREPGGQRNFVQGIATGTPKSAMRAPPMAAADTTAGAKPIVSNGKQIPLPIIFDSSLGNQTQQVKQIPSFSLRATGGVSAKGGNALRGANVPLAPPEPPICVRPLSSAPIDIASSVTILSSGDWFYKWNRQGNEVQPRFLWLDTSKYVLAWSRQQSRSSSFTSCIKVEQMSQVTTSQVVERDELDRPRVFYVLLIHTDTRVLQLATEVREKLDVWYEAVGNVIACCRAGGPLTKLSESSE